MVVQTRKSKYVEAALNHLTNSGHATNAQLASGLRTTYPDLSDTTVHRITQRLLLSGQLSLAPLAQCGARRFDINTSSHDHFECTDCQKLVDIVVSGNFRQELEQSIGGCNIGGSLTIQGVCQECLNKRR